MSAPLPGQVRTAPKPRVRFQPGSALIVVLMMLVAVMSIGTSAAHMALQGEKAARNERDRQIALQAAEAALLDAETDIEHGARSHLFAHDRAEGFASGCAGGRGNPYQGLCQRAEAGIPVWLSVNFLDDPGSAAAVDYGSFTGQAFPSGQGILPARLPRYVIEVMPFNSPGAGATAEDLGYFYRITAIGFGTRESTRVVLQTFYRKGAT